MGLITISPILHNFYNPIILIMRKYVLFQIVIGMLLITSCESNEPNAHVVNNQINCNESTNGRIRTVIEAADIAREGIKMLDDESSRASVRTFSPLNVQTVVEANSRSDADTLLYVFNFDADMGYAIVAANKSYNPALLAITERGSYNANQPTDNPGLKMFMENALNLVRDSIKQDDLFDPDDPNPDLIQYKMGTDTTLVVNIIPKCYLRWGQYYPEGLLFPGHNCGCGPTAVLTAMGILKKPTEYKFVYEDGSEEIETIDWDDILLHRQSGWSENSSSLHLCRASENAHEMMAKIARDIYRQTRIETDTIAERTTTSTTGIFNFFNNFEMAVTQFGYSGTETVKSHLSNKHIGIVCAQTKPNEEGKYYGHIFILDGLKEYLFVNGEWIKEYGKPWECVNELWRRTDTYFHLNWGLDGCDNGYFYAFVFNPSKVVERDPNTSSSYINTDMTFKSLIMYVK